MEGFGNYDPDADKDRRGILERGFSAISNLGEYVPETWKQKLGLYDYPPRSATYASGPKSLGAPNAVSGFHMQPRRQVSYRADVQESRPPAADWTSYKTRQQPPEVFSPVTSGDYERRIVTRIVEPRGGRLCPSTSELDVFRRDVAGLDLSVVVENLKPYICDPTLAWQWRLRALSVLNVLVQPRDDDAGSKIQQIVIEDEGLMSALVRSSHKQCDQLANEVLSVLGRAPPRKTTAKGAADETPSTKPTLDLLDLDAPEAPSAAAHPTAAASGGLLDDLLL